MEREKVCVSNCPVDLSGQPGIHEWGKMDVYNVLGAGRVGRMIPICWLDAGGTSIVCMLHAG
jgi:hypothetical protein